MLFVAGQGNGGALPCYYTCDICDQNARGSSSVVSFQHWPIAYFVVNAQITTTIELADH